MLYYVFPMIFTILIYIYTKNKHHVEKFLHRHRLTKTEERLMALAKF